MPDKKLSPDEIAANLEVVRNIPLWVDKAGLTQEQLANNLDVSFGTVSKWFRGLQAMTTARLFAISQILKVDPKLLLTNPSDPEALDGYEDAANLLKDLSAEDRERWLQFGANLKSSKP